MTKPITEEDLSSGLESYPDFLLIRDANILDRQVDVFGLAYLLDRELDRRCPVAISEVIGYENGKEIWLDLTQ